MLRLRAIEQQALVVRLSAKITKNRCCKSVSVSWDDVGGGGDVERDVTTNVSLWEQQIAAVTRVRNSCTKTT